MADKFDVYNDKTKIAHTEADGTDGQTTIGLSGLTASTTYDKISVAYAGKDGKTAVPSFDTKVPAAVVVTGVTLDKATHSIAVGASETAVATIAPANATDKSVTWKSSDPTVVTVDTSGKYTGVKAGTADIAVTTHDGSKTAKVTVTVTTPIVKVTGVTMSQKTAAMKVGDTKQVTGTVAPENATDKAVTYASGDTAIATVASDGTITAVAVGTVDITVTTHDGAKTDKVVVTVSASK